MEDSRDSMQVESEGLRWMSLHRLDAAALERLTTGQRTMIYDELIAIRDRAYLSHDRALASDLLCDVADAEIWVMVKDMSEYGE